MQTVECATIAYADPPYPGQAVKHYADETLCQEVNHRVLIGTLCEHYDVWALSTSSSALKEVLRLCPDDVRVGAWVKPFASFKVNVNPAYTWEPIVFFNSRSLAGRGNPTIKDHLIATPPKFERRHKTKIKGEKPEAFWFWLFDLLGATVHDSFHDLFPGSGEGRKQWERFVRARSAIPEPLSLFATQEAHSL